MGDTGSHYREIRSLFPGCGINGIFPIIMLTTWALGFATIMITFLRLITWFRLVKTSGLAFSWSVASLVMSLAAQSLATVWVIKIYALHKVMCSEGEGYDPTLAIEVGAAAYAVLARDISTNAISVGKLAVVTYLTFLLRGARRNQHRLLYLLATTNVSKAFTASVNLLRMLIHLMSQIALSLTYILLDTCRCGPYRAYYSYLLHGDNSCPPTRVGEIVDFIYYVLTGTPKS